MSWLSKKSTKPARKKHGFAYYVVGLFTLAIELMLGVNAAFLVDQSVRVVSDNMLEGTPLAGGSSFIALIVSLGVGFCFIWGGLWTFSGFIDSLEDARAYVRHYRTNKWPVAAVWGLYIGIIAIDFATLFFRASYFAAKGETPLMAFFVVLILLPPVLGPLLHVLENTPRDRRLARVRQYAEAVAVDDIETAVKDMNPALRTRLLSGDGTALRDYYAQAQQQEEMYESRERQKLQGDEAQRDYAQRPLV